LPLRQFGESALQITQLEPRVLIGWTRQTRRQLLGSDSVVPHPPTNVADVPPVQHREQPGPKIGPRYPEMALLERAGETILDEIIRGDDIARQHLRPAPEPWDQGDYFFVQISIH